jgi:hypothetical protein
MNLSRGRRKFLCAMLAAPLPCLAEVRVVELEIAGRKPRGGVRTVRIASGERVRLRVRSDEALTLHVHGLEYEMAVKPGVEAALDLDGRSTGRFPVTAHLRGHAKGKKAPEPTLLYLEVHPR